MHGFLALLLPKIFTQHVTVQTVDWKMTILDFQLRIISLRSIHVDDFALFWESKILSIPTQRKCLHLPNSTRLKVISTHL